MSATLDRPIAGGRGRRPDGRRAAPPASPRSRPTTALRRGPRTAAAARRVGDRLVDRVPVPADAVPAVDRRRDRPAPDRGGPPAVQPRDVREARAPGPGARGQRRCRPGPRRGAQPLRRGRHRRPRADQAGDPRPRHHPAADPVARDRRGDEGDHDRARRLRPDLPADPRGAARPSSRSTSSSRRPSTSVAGSSCGGSSSPARSRTSCSACASRSPRPGWPWWSSSRSTPPAASAT